MEAGKRGMRPYLGVEDVNAGMQASVRRLRRG
jgi:hypothetical protein